MKSREEILKEFMIPEAWLYSELTQAMTAYADQFAVEFAEWCICNTTPCGEDEWFYKQDYYTTHELLTIFKKERGIE